MVLLEVDFLREARASGVPVLGICFGAQLLAEARGGATVLARTSDGCAAFAIEGAVGLQFHPEMTEPLLRRWLSVPGSVRDGSADRLLDVAAAIGGADLRERVGARLGTVPARLF